MKIAPEKFRFAALAVDVPVYGLINGKLHGLIAPVNRPPHYVNVEGFLGGMVDAKENALEAAQRVLQEKGNLKDVYLEQLYTFSEVDRDKRNRVVSVAHLGLVRPDTAAAYAHPHAHFVPIQKLHDLAYDHDEIHRAALARLRGNITHSTIAQFLLPRHFTLTELQSLYEMILGHELDKRNFRKKILALEILKDTGRMQEGVRNRPAALYTFTTTKLQELPLIA